MPNYHIFKNIKNNIGENHTTFWGISDMIYAIEDKEKENAMTKEVLIDFINKFIEICENNLTTGIHVKLSEENMFNFVEESDLRVKEIKSYKIDHNEVCHAYLLENGKSFIIHGRYYFTVYDSNNFGKIVDKNFEDEPISYISPIGNKNFLVSFKQNYELYELKNEKYVCTEKIILEKKEIWKNFKKKQA